MMGMTEKEYWSYALVFVSTEESEENCGVPPEERVGDLAKLQASKHSSRFEYPVCFLQDFRYRGGVADTESDGV